MAVSGNDIARAKHLQQRRRIGHLVGVSFAVLCIILLTLLMMTKILSHQKTRARFLFLSEKTLSEDVSCEAIIYRDCQVLAAPRSGRFEAYYGNGATVAKEAALGVIIADHDLARYREYRKAEQDVMDRRYDLLFTQQAASAERLFAAQNSILKQQLGLVYEQNLTGQIQAAFEVENNLRRLQNERNEAIMALPFQDEELSRRQDYMNSLANGLNLGTTLQASHAGTFIRSLSSNEEEFSTAKLSELTPEGLTKQLKELPWEVYSTTEQAAESVALYGICPSFTQYFACFVPLTFEPKIKVGDVLKATCPDNASYLDQLIVERAEAAKNGLMLVLSSDRALQNFIDRHRVHLNLDINQRRGLRVPVSALLDYQAGNTEASVMAVKGGYLVKTRVRIEASNQDYALIRSWQAAGDGGALLPTSTPMPSTSGLPEASQTGQVLETTISSVLPETISIEAATLIVLNPQDVKEGDSLDQP